MLFYLFSQALLLDRRRGGDAPQRVLRALGRYEQTPRELVLELAGNEPQTVAKLAEETRLKQMEVRRAVEDLASQAICEGKGWKGGLYTYVGHQIRFIPDSPL